MDTCDVEERMKKKKKQKNTTTPTTGGRAQRNMILRGLYRENTDDEYYNIMRRRMSAKYVTVHYGNENAYFIYLYWIYSNFILRWKRTRKKTVRKHDTT